MRKLLKIQILINFGLALSQDNVINDVFQARGNCEDQFDLGYRCVPYYNCDECNRIITDGRGLFDPRTTTTRCETNEDHEFLTTSICPKIVQVCCLHPNSSLPELPKSGATVTVVGGDGVKECDLQNIDDMRVVSFQNLKSHQDMDLSVDTETAMELMTLHCKLRLARLTMQSGLMFVLF